MGKRKGPAVGADKIREMVEPFVAPPYDINVDGKRWVGCNIIILRARGRCHDVGNTYAENYLRECVAESAKRDAAKRTKGSREIRGVPTVAFVAPGSTVDIHVGSDIVAIVRALFPGARWRVPSEHPLFPTEGNTCVAWLRGYPVAVVPPLKGEL